MLNKTRTPTNQLKFVNNCIVNKWFRSQSWLWTYKHTALFLKITVFSSRYGRILNIRIRTVRTFKHVSGKILKTVRVTDISTDTM